VHWFHKSSNPKRAADTPPPLLLFRRDSRTFHDLLFLALFVLSSPLRFHVFLFQPFLPSTLIPLLLLPSLVFLLFSALLLATFLGSLLSIVLLGIDSFTVVKRVPVVHVAIFATTLKIALSLSPMLAIVPAKS
jgi:hypothetical protein